VTVGAELTDSTTLSPWQCARAVPNNMNRNIRLAFVVEFFDAMALLLSLSASMTVTYINKSFATQIDTVTRPILPVYSQVLGPLPRPLLCSGDMGGVGSTCLASGSDGADSGD